MLSPLDQMPPQAIADLQPCLLVDIAAITRNYNQLCTDNPDVNIACVIKADAYGLGAEQIGPALYAVGCRHFFVAYAFEGRALREVLPAAEIFVFHGPAEQSLTAFDTHRLTPVLNTIAQINLWKKTLNRPAALHLDTGLNRLGLPEADIAQSGLFDGLQLSTLISHLSHGSDRDETRNAAQYARLETLLDRLTPLFPEALVSFKASAGIYSALQSSDQIYRAGISLYGSSAFADGANTLNATTALYAPVLEIQNIRPGDSVGYNGTYIADRPHRIATLGIGYADGFKRLTPETRSVIIGATKCPVIGTVSMDLTTVDLSDCGAEVTEGMYAEIFGPHIPLDEAARLSSTIGYELLTSLGPRVERVYV